MDWTTNMTNAECAAWSTFLIEAIAKSIGVEPNAELIDRAIYKGTDCGAWVRFDEQGVKVGTIVEGSDAEYSERISLVGITTDLEEAECERLIAERFWEAVEACERFASEVWQEMEEPSV